MSERPLYSRIIVKLSGESLAGNQGFGLDFQVVARIAEEIKAVFDAGVEVCVVVGGGNIWRGAAASERGMDRATADYAGMLATVINALALQRCHGADRTRHAAADRYRNETCGGALHTPTGDSAPRKGQGSDLCGWNGQSVLHH